MKKFILLICIFFSIDLSAHINFQDVTPISFHAADTHIEFKFKVDDKSKIQTLYVFRDFSCLSSTNEIGRNDLSEYNESVILLKTLVEKGDKFTFGLNVNIIPDLQHSYWSVNLKTFRKNSNKPIPFSIKSDVGNKHCSYTEKFLGFIKNNKNRNRRVNLCPINTSIAEDMRIPESYFTKDNADKAVNKLKAIIDNPNEPYAWITVPNVNKTIEGYILRRDALNASDGDQDYHKSQFCIFMEKSAWWYD